MQRIAIMALFGALLVLGWQAGLAPTPTEADTHATSGQGDYKFKVVYKGSHLPKEAQGRARKGPWRVRG